MRTDADRKYRKISRNFKGRIALMNKIPEEDSIKLFFELCDFCFHNYIRVERERYPNKSIKEIIINMNKSHEKVNGRRKNKWK